MVNMCVLCRSSESDELIFGKTIREGSMTVHHNCLYLSSNLVQRGNRRIGILRFLKDDIVAEARRCQQLYCCYCHRPGANIGCCKSGCRRTFHTKCGVDNLAQSQFRDTYKSYCHQHVLHHRHRPASEKEPCVICKDPLIDDGERFSVVTMLYSPCCRNGWYHRQCLQSYANTAGYFFKCPLCNNAKIFHDVALMGISLSSQDASWETEPNAFAEHFVRPLECTAEECRALGGRSDTATVLLYCQNCGSNPAHTLCTDHDQNSYVCGVCSIVSPAPPPLAESINVDDEESSSSDDCDPLETFAQEQPTNQTTTTAANNTRNFIHSKLCVSGWDDTDTEDDEDVFQRAAEGKQQQQQQPTMASDEQPSTSAAAVGRRSTRSTLAAFESAEKEKKTSMAAAVGAPTRRRSLRLSAQNNQENTEPTTSGSTSSTIRSRRTMPARRLDTEEKESNEAEKKEHEPKKRCVSPAPFAGPSGRRLLRSISPEVKPLRRRTMASSNPSNGLMDLSCVANRTRNRLPGYLAHRK